MSHDPEYLAQCTRALAVLKQAKLAAERGHEDAILAFSELGGVRAKKFEAHMRSARYGMLMGIMTLADLMSTRQRSGRSPESLYGLSEGIDVLLGVAEQMEVLASVDGCDPPMPDSSSSMETRRDDDNR